MKLVGIAMLPFMKNVARGTATSMYVATASDLPEQGDSYFADCAPARLPKLAGDRGVEENLWKLSERLTSP